MEKANYTRVLFTNDWNYNEAKNPAAALVYIQGHISKDLMYALESRQLGATRMGGKYQEILKDLTRLLIGYVEVSSGKLSEYTPDQYDLEYRVISRNY